MISKNFIDKQHNFLMMLAALLQVTDKLGYKASGGELYRPPELAALYARQGRGIEKSLHSLALAVDIRLFKDYKYLQTTEDYAEIGEIWERFGGAWGGRFGDDNHFSLSHNGIK